MGCQFLIYQTVQVTKNIFDGWQWGISRCEIETSASHKSFKFHKVDNKLKYISYSNKILN